MGSLGYGDVVQNHVPPCRNVVSWRLVGLVWFGWAVGRGLTAADDHHLVLAQQQQQQQVFFEARTRLDLWVRVIALPRPGV